MSTPRMYALLWRQPTWRRKHLSSDTGLACVKAGVSSAVPCCWSHTSRKDDKMEMMQLFAVLQACNSKRGSPSMSEEQTRSYVSPAYRCPRTRWNVSPPRTCPWPAPHCQTPQHTALHCTTLHHTAPHCTTLQHTATHCTIVTLQHTS